jgi:hypothetical protein
MSRPRSTDPSVALSIAVPQSLKTRLDQELSYKQSRSLWVCGAIKAKLKHVKEQEELEKVFDYTSIPNIQLIGMLHGRELIDDELFTLLRMRVVEIEEGR